MFPWFFFPLQVSASELNELIITLWHLKQWKGVLIQRFWTEAEFAKITWGDFFNSYICLLLPTQNLKFLIEPISVKKHNFSSESCNDFNVASSRDHLWTTEREKTFTDSTFWSSKNCWTVWLADSELGKPEKLGKSQGSNQNHTPNPNPRAHCWSLSTRRCPTGSTVTGSGHLAYAQPCFFCYTWNMNGAGPMPPTMKTDLHPSSLVY